jgi:hypothetical protein
MHHCSKSTTSLTKYNVPRENTWDIDLGFVIRIQTELIKTYKEKLDKAQSDIETIRDDNHFDVERITDALIHSDKDKEPFKNALLFMQRRLNIMLDSMSID